MHNISTNRIVFGLQALLDFHVKRLEHYSYFVDQCTDLDLILLFNKNASQSKACIATLKQTLDGYPRFSLARLKTNRLASRLKQILNSFNSEERNDILHKCEAIERAGVKIHTVAMVLSYLPDFLRADIISHKENLEKAIRTFNRLRTHKVEDIKIA